MSSKIEKLEQYTEQLHELGVTIDTEILEWVVDGLGPANYQTDASLVSATDDEELARVYTNFIADELAIADKEVGMAALLEVMEMMSGIARKHRAVVYYLLAKKFGK